MAKAKIDFDLQVEYASDFKLKGPVLEYPHLLVPDTKFDDDGKYRTNLVMSKEDAQAFVDHYTEVLEAWVDAVKATLKKDTVKIGAPQIVPHDDDPNLVVIKAGIRATTKDGKTRRVPVVDGLKRPVPVSTRIGSGTTVNINLSLWPWYTATLGCGIAIRPKAVQIVNLVEWGTDAAADFDDIDDGFTVESDDAEVTSGADY